MRILSLTIMVLLVLNPVAMASNPAAYTPVTNLVSRTLKEGFMKNYLSLPAEQAWGLNAGMLRELGKAKAVLENMSDEAFNETIRERADAIRNMNSESEIKRVVDALSDEQLQSIVSGIDEETMLLADSVKTATDMALKSEALVARNLMADKLLKSTRADLVEKINFAAELSKSRVSQELIAGILLVLGLIVLLLGIPVVSMIIMNYVSMFAGTVSMIVSSGAAVALGVSALIVYVAE
ncbi:MAG: hypothetical protein A2583_13545 [Bdellovibrionales bacterium RIFOXYD1_FULL_53_11]|nr:MAG: hypothetical protein A2583_13545 [Bdellovibrionales bacterium RIFOXYD1_FULL_53_11]